ncbi:MAG: AAA family ATPase [Hyphomonadaceae bacterium]|nr:AAA family ATPase [Hyphomonadaceae bacterium]
MTNTNNVAAHIDNSRARQNINKENAIALAKIGVAVFPSSGKTPLIPMFNKLDTEISPADRDAAIEKYREHHEDKAPIHVGATKDPEVIKRMWRAHRDAVPSIATGPSGLVVLDADQKDDGPAKMRALFEENGGLPQGVIDSPTKSQGVHFIFADPERSFSNKAGALKKEYGTDVRGSGGQIVAPGSLLDDGRSYGTRDDLVRFLRAYNNKSFPEVPEFIQGLIGAQAEHNDDTSPSKERDVIKALQDADWDKHENDFDPDLPTYDLEALRTTNAEFKELYDNPSSDCSTNRFLAARHVMREWPDMPAPALSIFFSQWEGAGTYTDEKPKSGEYDDRQIAREWLKNQGLSKPSKGDAFGVVEVDEKAEYLEVHGNVVDFDSWHEGIQAKRAERGARLERAEERAQEEVSQPTSKDERAKRFVYIENIRGAVRRALDWCIKFFVARGTTSVATGLWGAGKTAVFTDIGLHVGHGFEWRGRKVKKGVVIYVALENSEDVERRVEAWCELMERAGRDVSGGAFVVHRGPCRLFDPTGKATRDEKDLIEIANTAAEHYGLPTAMIVIDTLAQSIMPGNDNDSQDAGIYTAAMQRIVAATGANVTALAHPTKSGEGVRGSGALQANVDTVIEVSRDGAGRGTIKAGSKFRIGNPSKVSFGYRLRSQSLGQDADGDDIDIVLAVEPSVDTGSMGAVEDDADAAALTPPDTAADKLAATRRVFKERVAHLSEATGEGLDKIGMTAKDVFAALNRDRKVSGLPELKDRTIVSRLLGRLAESGEIVKSGDNRATEYKLVG